MSRNGKRFQFVAGNTIVTMIALLNTTQMFKWSEKILFFVSFQTDVFIMAKQRGQNILIFHSAK